MNFSVLPARQLTHEQTHAWAELQQENPLLASPFFRPEYTLAVAAVRDDVEVAVLEEGGRPVGFFPFQREWWAGGRVVGGRLTDYQGVIARPGLEWDAIELLRATRLSNYKFGH